MLVGHWMSEVRRDDTCQNSRVRMETWNLEVNWSSGHLAALEVQECDAWLLPEMLPEASIPDTTAHCAAHASRERPSVHPSVLAVDREVLALGLLATSDGSAT